MKASGTVYHIEADGSVIPSTPLIARNGNLYTFTAIIIGAIWIEKDNIVVDGVGYPLEGQGETGIGINISSRTKVTIQNIGINAFDYGIYLTSSNNNTITGCSITSCTEGIWLGGSSAYNTISGNRIMSNVYDGIYLSSSFGNAISGNNITSNTFDGIYIQSSSNNTVSANVIANNGWGVESFYSSNNSILHNNFINNIDSAYSSSSVDLWDAGYPSGGNYWSNYGGTDLLCGPNQNETGSDGIGDASYEIDPDNRDNFPLMVPYPCIHAIVTIGVKARKTVVGQGFTMEIDVEIANLGHFIETFNVTACANSTAIATIEVAPLESGKTIALVIAWITTGYDRGNYTIKAVSDTVPGEAYSNDNTLLDGHVFVAMVGDLTGGTANPWDFIPDNIVDGSDIVMVTRCYGAWPSAPPPFRWIPNCDINNDYVIDGSDIIVISRNYGNYG